MLHWIQFPLGETAHPSTRLSRDDCPTTSPDSVRPPKKPKDCYYYTCGHTPYAHHIRIRLVARRIRLSCPILSHTSIPSIILPLRTPNRGCSRGQKTPTPQLHRLRRLSSLSPPSGLGSIAPRVSLRVAGHELWRPSLTASHRTTTHPVRRVGHHHRIFSSQQQPRTISISGDASTGRGLFFMARTSPRR